MGDGQHPKSQPAHEDHGAGDLNPRILRVPGNDERRQVQKDRSCPHQHEDVQEPPTREENAAARRDPSCKRQGQRYQNDAGRHENRSGSPQPHLFRTERIQVRAPVLSVLSALSVLCEPGTDLRGAGAIIPSVGDDALAYNRLGIRPAR